MEAVGTTEDNAERHGRDEYEERAKTEPRHGFQRIVRPG